MEENFSQELAQVSGASSALLELQEKFNGAVHTISSLPELKKLNLEEKFLLLVRLAPTSTSIKEESVIAENGEKININLVIVSESLIIPVCVCFF